MPIDAQTLRAEGKPAVGIVRNKNQQAILALLTENPNEAFTYKEVRDATGIKYPAACYQAIEALIKGGRIAKLSANDAKNTVHVFLATQ